MRICIDPGHGGKDPGALGHAVEEADYNLIMASVLTAQLTALGHKVLQTRTTDIFLELKERTSLANKFKADLFISIHANGAEAPAAEGMEVHYHKQNSMLLAKKVFQAMSDAFPIRKKRGVKLSNFYVIKWTTMPSILIEGGFITNPKEQKFLFSKTDQISMASAICRGIETWSKYRR